MMFSPLAVVMVLTTLAAGLTPTQERGREIFLHGQSADGHEISAVLGTGDTPISATLLPCANCHGIDARGNAEGGIRAADIASATLARSLTLGPRLRPAYTTALLKRAITMGFDAAGNVLDPAMPRFRLSQQDANDLIAYLDIVGNEPQPGISDDSIRINVLGSKEFTTADALIYGRKIVISHVRDGDAFLTIDASIDASTSMTAAARDGMPTLVIYSAAGEPGASVFVLTASAQDQIAALETYARREPSKYALLTSDCRSINTIDGDAVVLMTSAAAQNCDLASVPTKRDHRVIVAAAIPPSAQANRDAINAALSITTAILAQLGRDVTRSQFLAALEHVYRAETPGFAPVTWSANHHRGTQAVWLMTLDVRQQRLIGTPGWVEAQ